MEESSQLKRYGLSRELGEVLERLPIPLAIIVAEELREGIEKVISDIRLKEATYSTTVRNQIVDKLYTFLSLSGRGKLREAVLITNSPEFNIYVDVDGRSIVNHSFSELMDVSEYMEEIDAFDKNGYYVVRLSSLAFLSRCQIVLLPYKNLVLKHAFAIYNIF